MGTAVEYSPFVLFAFVAWFFPVFLAFAIFPPTRVVFASYLIGWMFLPNAAYSLLGIPDVDKALVVSVSVLLGVVVFDVRTVFAFRPKWFDIPIALLCIAPLFSSLSNDLGLYDGFSAALREVLANGIPYFLGRLYLTNFDAMRELVVATFIAGLVYMPLCLYEIRMSPQLHYKLYGFQSHSFLQHFRGGGYRPLVFMRHGIEVAVWMATATAAGFGLWLFGTQKRVWRIPTLYYVAALLVTTILCKTFIAHFLLLLGFACLLTIKYAKIYIHIPALGALALVYIILRGTGLWDGQLLVDTASLVAPPERIESLTERMQNENILAAKALERPLFGWGRWGRNRVYSLSGQDVSVTDGRWIMILGTMGVVGLIGFLGTLLLPIFLLRRRVDLHSIVQPATAPVVVLAVLLTLWILHNLPNASGNPFYFFATGGLANFAATKNVRRMRR